MEFNLEVGLTCEVVKDVNGENTAQAVGSGSLKVFGTPMMIALIENAALNAVQSKLPEGFTTVGTHLDVSHIAATPVGMQVTGKAELIEVSGKKLTFKVEAFDEKDKIGEGTHTRFIIDANKFMDRTNSK
jgi:predicted thioesterase